MNYKACYDRLIRRAQWRTLDKETYVERHHILPRCLGGNDKCSNLVKLTGEEHYTAHLLLVKIHPVNNKIIFAARMMTLKANGKRINNKMYGWLRKQNSEARKSFVFTLQHRQRLSEATKGRKLSDAHKLKVSKANTGVVRSEEFKRKVSEFQTGRICSEETRKKFSERMKNRIVSKETCLKMSLYRKGKSIHSDEHKQALSKNMKGNKHALGNKLSDEAKEKIRKAVTGRKHTLESRARMTEAQKGNTNNLGKPLSEETKKKIGSANKGRKYSEESKYKMRVAWGKRKIKQLESLVVNDIEWAGAA